MVTPEKGMMYTKVIVFKYPTYLDPDYLLLNNDSVVWAKRNSVRGEKQSQVVALVKGEAPERIFVQGLGYRKVVKYIEEPILCMKCSRWGHMAWKCQFDSRCRYCGKKHDSRECRVKIKNGEKIVPSCCNCRGSHNAGSYLCRMKPHLRDSRTGATSRIDVSSKEGKIVQQEHGGNSWKPMTAPMNNVWEKGTETIKASLGKVGNAAEKIKPCGNKVQVNIVNSEVGTQILEYLKKLEKRIEALEKLTMGGRRGEDGGETGREVESETGREMESETGREMESETGREMESQTGREMESQTGREMESQTGREMKSQTGREMESETGREMESETGREMESQTGREMESEIGREVESETGREMCVEESKEEHDVLMIEDSQENELSSSVSVQPSVVTNVETKVKVKRYREIRKKLDMNKITFDASSCCANEEKAEMLQCWESLSEKISYLMECDRQGKGSFIKSWMKVE
ncbi:uncharacterized protein [Procambarus clarkii]|uniref:uncharacterized protein n=1 Tax=Procambarus clarkii TaxID=6728 RepID=UPI00374401B1